MIMKKVVGFMIVKDFDLRNCIFCRSSEDADHPIVNNLSGGCPIYRCEGIQITDELYVWTNPLTNEEQHVIYPRSTVEDKYCQKKIK